MIYGSRTEELVEKSDFIGPQLSLTDDKKLLRSDLQQ
jgi:hypothetical protein